MLQAAEWVRRLLLTLVALAASTLPAVAIEPMIARLAEVDDAVKRVAPQFVCTDPTDKATCRQIRHAAAPKGGWYMSEDFAGGQRMLCFSPQRGLPTYRVCSGGLEVRGEIETTHSWELSDPADPRCTQ